MHAASVILLSWAMIGAACFFSDMLAGVTAGVLGLLVAAIGLPHGAADHRFARPRLEPALGVAWLPVFLAGYAAVMAAVVWGWFAAPAVTVGVFFLASAWHFGLEEPRLPIGPRWLRPLFRFARGGLVIWTPLVCRGGEVDEILGVVAPGGPENAIRQTTVLLTACAWVMLAVAAAAWMLQALAASRRRGRIRRVLLVDNALVGSLVVLFAVASPLVGFIVYFCGWHSVRGLRRLRIALGETWPELLATLAPLTAGSIALIAVVAWLWLGGANWSESLIRTTFVGLSAVAMPHLLLHGVAPLFRSTDRRRSTPSLHAGSPA